MEVYIRNQRSNNVIYSSIKGIYGKRKAENNIIIEGEVEEESIVETTIAFLKHKIIANQNDRNIVSQRMERIHVNRFLWIQESSPSLTEIINRYPRYKDCFELVLIPQ